jgi:long-chain fatty acid transport protein
VYAKIHAGIRLAALICFLGISGNAHAEGFALYEYGARGVALGGALMAREPDASAVAYNPALMTRLPGIRVMGGVSAISPDGKMTLSDDQGREETISLKPAIWLVPHLYYVQQLNESFTLGIGEFSRFGLGLAYPHDWMGRFNIYDVSLQTISLNPSIAWAATDKLSLAAGLEVIYATIDLKKRAQFPVYPPPGKTVSAIEVDSNIQDADGAGLAVNLAGHYRVNDQWAVGLQYRSQAEIRAHGEVQYAYMGYSGDPASEAAAPTVYGRAFKDGGVHATVVLPDSVAGGIAWTPLPELSLEVGAVWTRWSTFRSLNIHLPEPIRLSENRKNWRDTWRLNAGAEYKALDWLTLRAGYVFDQSPMTGRYADYLVPTDDRQMLSLGAGFAWDAWTLDLAYAWIKPKTRSYRANEETHVRDSRTRDSATNILSLSLGYRF